MPSLCFICTKRLVMILTVLRRLLSLVLHPLPAAVTAVGLSLLLFDAFPADSLMYHLPFSARFLHLPGFPDLSNYFEGRYQGFPSLWRILLGPGLAWNHPRLFILPNLFAFGALAYCCRRFLGLSAALVTCLCLAFPVALYGFRSSLQDFFVNALVLTAAIILYRATVSFDNHSRKSKWIDDWDFFGLFCLALAANVKLQGLFIAVVVLVTGVAFRSYEFCRNGRNAFPVMNRRTAAAAILVMFVFLQPIMNVSRFRNPVYPIRLPLLGGPEPVYSTSIQYLPQIPLVTGPLSYIVSVLEIDPIIRSKAGFSFVRSWHNHNQPKPEFQPVPPQYPWITTGGSNGLLFLVILVGAFLSVYPLAWTGSLDMTPSLLLRRRLLLTSLLFMFLPQAMELRYYMTLLFIPALVAVSGQASWLRQLMRWIIVAGLWLGLLSSFLQPLYFWSKTGEWISARGLLSPDVYSGLPAKEQCIQRYGPTSTALDRTKADVPTLMACAIRLRTVGLD
jgi:hypothetical protein